MTNIEIFLIEKDIVDSLRNKETSKCLAWCNENKSKLKKINVSYLKKSLKLVNNYLKKSLLLTI